MLIMKNTIKILPQKPALSLRFATAAENPTLIPRRYAFIEESAQKFLSKNSAINAPYKIEHSRSGEHPPWTKKSCAFGHQS